MRNHRLRFVLLLFVVTAHALSQHTEIVAQALGKTAFTDLARELRRLPPVPADKSLETFEIHGDFRLELVAAEPLVSDPIDACFDEHGRMFVAEMHGYPYSAEKRQQCPDGRGRADAGIIRMLEDTDRDGIMDRSIVFADKISWPQSVCCYRGGLFVLAPPHLYYFADSNHDDVADVRQIVYSGFSRANVQALANNLKWGPDLWIYGAGGRSGAHLKHRGQDLLTLGRRDFRFDPQNETLQPVSGGAQFGHSFDDWGNRFVCSNSNHIQHVVHRLEDDALNPLRVAVNPLRSIAREGAAAPVYRRSPAEPWRIVRTRRRAADPKYANRLPATELVPTGFFTSATGVTIYRGNAYPTKYRGQAFIGDVGGNLVHRKSIVDAGRSFIATRADIKQEFITSRDTWFRPVNFVNAPDGTLYLLDMYRETIEHPYSIPADIKSHLDLESGHDRGRIYRLVHSGSPPKSYSSLHHLNNEELLEHLRSSNCWNRETAQRLLWERQAVAVRGSLEEIARKDSLPQARLTALCLLQRLKILSTNVLTTAVEDQHPSIREWAVRFAGVHEEISPALLESLSKRTKDEAVRVRCALAFAAARIEGGNGAKLVFELVGTKQPADVREAVAVATYPHAQELLEFVFDNKEWNSQKLKNSSGLVSQIIPALMHQGHQQPVRGLVEVALRDGTPESQLVVLSAVQTGLKFHPAQSMSAYFESVDPDGTLLQSLQRITTEAVAVATNPNTRSQSRLAAMQLFLFANPQIVQPAIQQLISVRYSLPVQRSALRIADQNQDISITEHVLEIWPQLSPQMRGDVIEYLLGNKQRARQLLQAVSKQAILISDLTAVQRQALREYPDVVTRRLAKQILTSGSHQQPSEVVAAWKNALDLDGDSHRGATVFRKRCASCHRADGHGHLVGPDLISVNNKSKEDLLIAILNPNREWQPNYTAYRVATKDGKTFSGLIAAENESSVTLLQAEAKTVSIRRNEIEIIESTGKSLMPTGLEKDFTRQELADVMVFIQQLKKPASGSSP